MAITPKTWAKLLQAARAAAQDSAVTYAQRGRRYARLSERELKDIFVRSMREMARKRNPDDCPEGYDAESELILRGIDMPYEEVRDDAATVRRLLIARLEEMDDESVAVMMSEAEAMLTKPRN